VQDSAGGVLSAGGSGSTYVPAKRARIMHRGASDKLRSLSPMGISSLKDAEGEGGLWAGALGSGWDPKPPRDGAGHSERNGSGAEATAAMAATAAVVGGSSNASATLLPQRSSLGPRSHSNLTAPLVAHPPSHTQSPELQSLATRASPETQLQHQQHHLLVPTATAARATCRPSSFHTGAPFSAPPSSQQGASPAPKATSASPAPLQLPPLLVAPSHTTTKATPQPSCAPWHHSSVPVSAAASKTTRQPCSPAAPQLRQEGAAGLRPPHSSADGRQATTPEARQPQLPQQQQSSPPPALAPEALSDALAAEVLAALCARPGSATPATRSHPSSPSRTPAPPNPSPLPPLSEPDANLAAKTSTKQLPPSQQQPQQQQGSAPQGGTQQRSASLLPAVSAEDHSCRPAHIATHKAHRRPLSRPPAFSASVPHSSTSINLNSSAAPKAAPFMNNDSLPSPTLIQEAGLCNGREGGGLHSHPFLPRLSSGFNSLLPAALGAQVTHGRCSPGSMCV